MVPPTVKLITAPPLLLELLLPLLELLLEPLLELELLELELLLDVDEVLLSLPPPQALSAKKPIHRTAYAGICFSMFVIPSW